MTLTPFQQLLVKVIEEDPLFDHWCLDPKDMISLDNKPNVPGPKLFTYYTKDGMLHADRAGVKEILNRVTFPRSEVGP